MFKRTKEDFVCERCGTAVSGNGYTNHCPTCLWSKHVDRSPGDRQNPCKGLMRPVRVTLEKGQYVVTHECLSCGKRSRCMASPVDRFEAMLAIVSEKE